MAHTAGLDPDRPDASPMDVETDDVCWICLDEKNKCEELLSPCSCPRKVHPRCMARWQLQQAGRAEETHCRFCNTTLADWKASLTPESLKPEVEKVQPIMVVYFEGEIHRIPVRQGNEGLSEFTSRIRELFKLPAEVDISLTFGCKEPMSGQHLKLEGMGAFDAAVHCASVAAAERQHKAGQRTIGAPLGAESSDEGEDTTDLLQSTLGGPIQRPPVARAAALAAITPPERPHAPPPRARHTPSDSQRASNNLPRAPTTPIAPTRIPSSRANNRQQYHETGHFDAIPIPTPRSRVPPSDMRRQNAVDPAASAFMNGRLPEPVTPCANVHDRIRDLERIASRIPRSSAPTRSPAVSTGGDQHHLYMPTPSFNPILTPTPGPSYQEDAMQQRRIRRTSSRNQHATAEAVPSTLQYNGNADAMDIDPPVVGPSEQADGSAAGSLMSPGGSTIGKRQGGPGEMNYDVPPNAISRSKLNSVLSFFGIRPPVTYTLGSTVTMDD